jgi:hypothetical protein
VRAGDRRGDPLGGSKLPTIDRTDPPTLPRNTQKLSLTLIGTGFEASSWVEVNGQKRQPAAVTSPTELKVNLDPADVRGPGDLAIVVVNPPGNRSATYTLKLT